ncbi:nucleoside 2-deoxyribosyltransferase [Streptomyces sp. NPDC054765]
MSRRESLSPSADESLHPGGGKPLVFVGGPFKGLLDPATGLLPDRHRNNYSALIDHFTGLGFEVDNAHRREAWGAEVMTPDVCTRLDYLALRKAVLFVAYPGDPPSPGTMVEIGWMSAMAKPMILLIERGQEVPPLVAGVHTIAPVRYVGVRNGSFDPDELNRCTAELLAPVVPAGGRSEFAMPRT